jgi:hypothetical protein
MMKLISIAVLLLATTAHAQEYKTFYGPNGNVVGRSTTLLNGQTTYYDANGAVIGRSQAMITNAKPKTIWKNGEKR